MNTEGLPLNQWYLIARDYFNMASSIMAAVNAIKELPDNVPGNLWDEICDILQTVAEDPNGDISGSIEDLIELIEQAREANKE